MTLGDVVFDKGTQPVWKGECVNNDNGFRRKVNLVVRESCSLQLKNVQNNVERVRAVRECDRYRNLFNDWKAELSACTKSELLSKSTTISTKLRQEANEFYKRKNLTIAQKGFTLSLCYAPVNSKEMVLAYSNRSACFMEMNQFENCLRDIEKALEVVDNGDHNGSEELQTVKTKLLERKLRCQMRLKEQDNCVSNDEMNTRSEFLMLRAPSDAIPSAENFVQIEDTPLRGRHVVVTKDVDPGTVIIMEEPYSKVLVKQFRWETEFCHYCFKSAISCPTVSCQLCVFAFYCSDKCMLSDYPVHKYECKMSAFLHKLALRRLVLLSFRTLIKLGSKNLYDFWKNVDHSSSISDKSTILGLDETGKYISSSYYPINCLIYHDESLSEVELRQYCLESLLLIEMLDKRTNFFKSVVNENSREEFQNFYDFAASILFLHQMNFPCNAHSLNMLQLRSKNPTTEEIRQATTTDFGAGAFALLSMINHSCDPNVTRVTLSNGLNAVVTIRGLKSGDEVLDNYGAHFALEDYQGRQRHLKENYNFACDCIPCTNNWPTMDKLQSLENRFKCPDCVKHNQSSNNCVIDACNKTCNKCGNAYNLDVLNNDLTEIVNEFHSAYDLVLQNKPYECINTLIKCLMYFESHVVPPFISTNYTQETLKQAFNLMTVNNKYQN